MRSRPAWSTKCIPGYKEKTCLEKEKRGWGGERLSISFSDLDLELSRLSLKKLSPKF